MLKCKNCGHKIVPVPIHYLGELKYFHACCYTRGVFACARNDTGEYCFNKSCMCEKPEK